MRRMRRTKRLTPSLLKKMIVQERARIRESSDPLVAGIEAAEDVAAEEVPADELADSLEKDIDHIKVLKIQERRLRRKLRRIAEARTALKRRVLKRLG